MSRYSRHNPDSPIIHDHFAGCTISKGLPGLQTMKHDSEPTTDAKTSHNEAQTAKTDTHEDPSMEFAEDRTDLTAVIESLDGKGLAKSHDISRLIVWMPGLGKFSGVSIEHYVKYKWNYKIHALVYPDGRVVLAEAE